jgi:hypothetical protein
MSGLHKTQHLSIAETGRLRQIGALPFAGAKQASRLPGFQTLISEVSAQIRLIAASALAIALDDVLIIALKWGRFSQLILASDGRPHKPSPAALCSDQ